MICITICKTVPCNIALSGIFHIIRNFTIKLYGHSFSCRKFEVFRELETDQSVSCLISLMPLYCIVRVLGRPLAGAISNYSMVIAGKQCGNTFHSSTINADSQAAIVINFKCTASSIACHNTNIIYIRKSINYNHICNCCSRSFILYIQGIGHIFPLHTLHIVAWHRVIATACIIFRILFMLLMSVVRNSLYRRSRNTGKCIGSRILILFLKIILSRGCSRLCVSMNSKLCIVSKNTIPGIISGFHTGCIFDFQILAWLEFKLRFYFSIKIPCNSSGSVINSRFYKRNFTIL